MNTFLSIYWLPGAALWYFVNGLLHDIFVIVNHKGKYDRELLRLLMDGHVLMLSGALLFACYLMMLDKLYWGGVIALIVAAFMLLYCFMIFPFLKSFATMAISVVVIFVSVKAISDLHGAGTT